MNKNTQQERKEGQELIKSNDQELNEIINYLKTKSTKSTINPFEPIHQTFYQSKSTSTSNELHSISLNLTNYQNKLQIEFDTVHEQFVKSRSDLINLIDSSKQSLQNLKTKNEQTHELYLKSEDDFIDQLQNPTSKTLTNTLINQIQWLNQLQHLKIWYSLLLDIQNRAETILNSTKNEKDDEKVENVMNKLVEIIERYRDFKLIEFENKSNLNILGLIQKIIINSLHMIIQIISSDLILAFEEELQWPLPIKDSKNLSNPKSNRIFKTFQTTCQFQTKLKSLHEMINLSPKKPVNLDYRIIWFPLPNLIAIKAIVKPIELRFRYHFDSQRSTNRLDKPEWYFDHILHRLEEHESFIKNDVQNLMNMNGYNHLNAMTEFSSLLIEMIEKKLKQNILQVLEIQPILAHTIYKAIEFDNSIKERGFQPQFLKPVFDSKDETWFGTVEVILGNETWFEIWFEAERKFFEEAGIEIMNSTETWQIATEDSRMIEKGQKSTISSLKIQEQIEEMKSRIERLPKVSYQLRFLIEFQFKLIQDYYFKIWGVLNAFESQYGSIGLIRSSVQVGGNEGVGIGQVGVLKLVKVFVSCEWMLSVFNQWNDELFYVELFEEIKSRQKTSSLELSWKMQKLIEEIGLNEENCESIFDPFIKKFQTCLEKCEGLIIKDLLRVLSLELKPYFSKRWDLEAPTTEEQDSSQQDLNLSPELIKPLTIWTQSIKSISKLIHKRKRKIYSKISEGLSNLILNKIILNGIGIRSITFYGAVQLRYDIQTGWINTIKDDLKICEIGWKRLFDAIKVLALENSQSGKKWNILRVCEVCFDERKVQDYELMRNELGIGNVNGLSKDEICSVLRRRPECWR